jgi:hypothetical protein
MRIMRWATGAHRSTCASFDGLDRSRQNELVAPQDHSQVSESGQRLEMAVVHPGQQQLIRPVRRQAVLNDGSLY